VDCKTSKDDQAPLACLMHTLSIRSHPSPKHHSTMLALQSPNLVSAHCILFFLGLTTQLASCMCALYYILHLIYSSTIFEKWLYSKLSQSHEANLQFVPVNPVPVPKTTCPTLQSRFLLPTLYFPFSNNTFTTKVQT
jgi:hypothetical protein